MNYTAKKLTALLLSLMMIFVSVFGSAFSVYAVEASGDGSDQTAVEQTIEDQEGEATVEEATALDAEEEVIEEIPEEEIMEEAPTEEIIEEIPEEEIIEEIPEEEIIEEIPEEEIIEEAPEEVAFEETKKVDGVKIRVTADAGVFPKGSTLEVKKVELSDEQEAAVDEASSDAKVAKQYNFDITVRDANGNEIQPNGKVNVSFETEEVADDALKAEVIHIDDEDNAEALAVETKGETATVETDGFSVYSLVFVYYNISTHQEFTATLSVGEGWVSIDSILAEMGYTGYGYIYNAQTDANSDIELYHDDEYDHNTWYVRAKTNASGQHGLEITFSNGSTANITVTIHYHNWDLVTDGATASLYCKAENCAFPDTYTATISAANATYNGAAHGAHVTHDMPSDVTVSDIRYYAGSSTTQMGSTPVNAGTYRAEATITPHGGTAKVISTTFTINKANIVITEAPAGLANLTYNHTFQYLHSFGSAKSATTSQEFSLRYAFAGSDIWETGRLTAMDAGTYTIKYYVPGDANHNSTEVMTFTATIAKKNITYKDFTVRNKTYDGTAAATLDYIGTLNGVFDGDAVQINPVATFSDKNAAVGKTVTMNYEQTSISGEDAHNYAIDVAGSQKTTTATISKKLLKIYWTGAGNNRYTGEVILPQASLRTASAITSSDGLAFAGDDIAVVVEQKNNGKELPSKNVGTGFEAEVTGLTGDDAENYSYNAGYEEVVYNIVEDLVSVNWDEESLVKVYNGELQLPEIISLDGIQTKDEGYIMPEFKVEGCKDAGIYKVSVELAATEGHEALLNDYVLDSSKDTWFEIIKAPLTITAGGWITYGQLYTDDDAHVSFQCEGFKPGDTVENSLDVSNMRYWSSQHQQFANVGEYSIETDKITSQNYEITNAPGKLTVYPRPVALEWYDNKDKLVNNDDNRYTYDGEEHSLTAKVAGTDDAGHMIYDMNNGGQHVDTILVVTYDGAQARTDANLNAEIAEEKWNKPYVAHVATLSNPNYTLIADPHGAPTVEVETAHQD